MKMRAASTLSVAFLAWTMVPHAPLTAEGQRSQGAAIAGELASARMPLGPTTLQSQAPCAKPDARRSSPQPGAVSQSQAPTVVSDEGVPLCYDPVTGKPVGKSQIFRGPVYVSPDGRRRAYAENELHVRGTSGEFDDCTSNSRLFVADAPDEAFRLALLQVPSRDRLGNDIKIVDWSQDSRFLLIETGWFQWGSDYGYTEPRRYSAESGIFSDEDPVPEAFSQLAGRNCAVAIQALGFSSDGGLVLKARPWFDAGDEKPSNDSCLSKEGLWLLDAKSGALSPLRDDYKVTPCTRVVKSAAK